MKKSDQVQRSVYLCPIRRQLLNNLRPAWLQEAHYCTHPNFASSFILLFFSLMQNLFLQYICIFFTYKAFKFNPYANIYFFSCKILHENLETLYIYNIYVYNIYYKNKLCVRVIEAMFGCLHEWASCNLIGRKQIHLCIWLSLFTKIQFFSYFSTILR